MTRDQGATILDDVEVLAEWHIPPEIPGRKPQISDLTPGAAARHALEEAD